LEKQIPPLRCGMTERKATASATATTGVLRFAQDDGEKQTAAATATTTATATSDNGNSNGDERQRQQQR
jgi:hypothetical protein